MWKTEDLASEVHAYPLNDSKPHEMTMGCPCQPKIDLSLNRPVVTHMAFDGRHLVEDLRGSN